MKNTQRSANESEEVLYLKQCLQRVENQTGWGSARQWTQSNYERLSEQIVAGSGIKISSSTLRRLFAPSSPRRRNPQIATRNALAAFVGYSDWDEFVRQQSTEASSFTMKSPSSGQGRRLTLIRRACVVAAVATAGLLSYNLLGNQGSEAILTGCLDQKGSSQVVFNHDLSALNAETFHIDFGDGNTQELTKSDYQTTHEYIVPSVYQVKLVADDEPLAGITVRKPTHGWTGNVLLGDSLYSLPNFRQPDRLYASPKAVYQGGTVSDEVYWTFYQNINDIGIDGDSFSVEARVKNDSLEGGISCYDVVLRVMCEQGWVELEFVQPDCTVWSDLTVGEVRRDGKWDDLSDFGQDFSYWRTIRVKVLDHQLSVLLDGEPVYEPVGYEQVLGAIQGVGFVFKGSGSVDFVKFHDLQDHTQVVLLDKALNL